MLSRIILCCCARSFERSCLCGPCRPSLPFEEWNCLFYLMLGTLRDLIQSVPTENVYAAQAVTSIPLPSIAWPVGVSCSAVTNQNVEGEWLIPPRLKDKEKVLLYFHGGAFVFVTAGCERFHTALLAKYFECRVFSVDYARPPKNPYPAPVESGLSAWNWLTEMQGVRPDQIVISGDSAGGNLAVSLALKLHKLGKSGPAGLLLMSPWVNMIPFESSSWVGNMDLDYISRREIVQFVVDLYTQDIHHKDPNVSPLHAALEDYQSLPPMWISVGSCEVLRDCQQAFHATAKRAGVNSTLFLGNGMPHVFQLFALAIPAPRAELMPCCMRCCGCGYCESTAPHPVWDSLEQAKVFLWSTAWAT